MLALWRATWFALQNTIRNFWMSLATVGVLTLTTLSITLVIVLNLLGIQVRQAVEQKVNIDFYFYPTVAEQDIFAAQDFLQAMPQVSSVVYTSQSEALESYKASHSDDQDLLQSLNEFDENIFPASLTVRAHTIGDYSVITDQFKASQYQLLLKDTDTVDTQSIINGLQRIVKQMTTAALTVSLFFVLIAVIVIFNTLRMTIYTHREEVGIMKLVGATNLFVRGPFIVEGMLFGIAAAAITLGLLYVVAWLLDPMVMNFFQGYDFSLWNSLVGMWPQFVFGEMVGAMLFTVLFSMVAMTRYLKV